MPRGIKGSGPKKPAKKNRKRSYNLTEEGRKAIAAAALQRKKKKEVGETSLVSHIPPQVEVASIEAAPLSTVPKPVSDVVIDPHQIYRSKIDSLINDGIKNTLVLSIRETAYSIGMTRAHLILNPECEKAKEDLKKHEATMTRLLEGATQAGLQASNI